MMRDARLTYIPLVIADRFDDFIIARDEQIMDAVKARARDFGTLTILKLLYPLNCNELTFSDLYTNSKIRMKRTFLKYLRFCVDYNFITKHSAGQNVIYSITDKGRIMLGLFLQKSN
jgi:predicted transcriptional regulator